MTRSTTRGRLVGAILGGLVLGSAAVLAPVLAEMLMNGAGATFPYPIYSKWFDEYAKIDQGVKFNYQSIGSGGGIRQITEWNDDRIKALNAGVSLPGDPIIVVHRSDGSGTTYIWVDYLSKVSKEWEQKVGRGTSVKWPVGLGGKGNEGVAGQVKNTPGALGYVELAYAITNKLPWRPSGTPPASSSSRRSRAPRPPRRARRPICLPTSGSR